MVILFVFIGGCVGNHRLYMLSPEERNLIERYRKERKKEKASDDIQIFFGWEEPKSLKSSENSARDVFLKIPEYHAGSIVDTKEGAMPAFSFEFLNIETSSLGSYSLNMGVGYKSEIMPIFIALDRKFPEFYGIEAGIFIGYDSTGRHKDMIYGVHLIGIRW